MHRDSAHDALDEHAVRQFLNHLVERSNRFIRARRVANTPSGVLRPSSVASLIEDLPRQLEDIDAGTASTRPSVSAADVLVRTARKANGDETLLAWLVHGIEQHGIQAVDLKVALAGTSTA